MDAGGDSASRRSRAARPRVRPASTASQVDPLKGNFLPVHGDLPPGSFDAPPLGRAVDQDGVRIVDVDVNAPLAKTGERRERAIRTIDRHVAHAAPAFLACSG